ncbi:MAG: CaiB/BaiF CoA transferase family protein [Solirubrobacteraceae bacterium]
MAGALDNLRVLDFSRVLAGPFATMLLADLGATVVKVERAGLGDDTRSWGPPFDERGAATYFESVNRNKQSIALDLRQHVDVELARRLALEADVLVENFRPGVMESFGLGYEQLRERSPRIVYCSITGFGRGAGASLPGYDLLVQAVGGLMSITGAPEGEPTKVGVALVDVLAGLFATVGVLAALRHRERTGEGQRVDVELLSALLAALVNQGSGYTAGGVVPRRIGNLHPSIAPYELLPCADGELVLAVGNDEQFRSLCRVLGVGELADDARFATNPQRGANRQALRDALAARLRTRPAGEWVRQLSPVRVPAGVVNDIAEAFCFAESLGLHPVVALERDDGSSVELTRNPIGLSATPPRYESAPPDLPERVADERQEDPFMEIQWR